MGNTNFGILSPAFIDDQLDKEKSYWQGKLSGDLVTTGIPLDFKRPALFSDGQEIVKIDIGEEFAAKLIRICGQKDSMIFTALAAALNICLYKYTGAQEIITGTAIHRQHSEVASLNKVLALRAQVSGGMTARQVLEGVRQTISEAYENQKYPFDSVLDLLGLKYPDNRAPLFNVVILLDQINDHENVGHLKNDATFAFSVNGNRIEGEIRFNGSLFRSESIELFAEHYRKVLEALIETPDLEIAKMELLDESKRRHLIYEFNETAREYPKGKSIHQLFEEQVEQTPDAVAVVAGEEELTYRELNRHANRLARRLRALGVGSGEQVAICQEHSIEVVISILAVLKTGAAYVPFDPAHPHGRMAFIIEDANIRTILAEARMIEALPPNSLEIICVDSIRQESSEENETNLEAESSAQDLAYVIYTSGSTGQPKGVRIQHRALVNYIWWAKQTYVRGESLNFALYSSLAFDLTVTSIFTPLITGSSIHVYRRDARGFPIADILKDNRVGVLKLTPSHMALIKDIDNSRSRIKRLIVGGENLETDLARQITYSFGGAVEIYNEYGPTEATVGCMIHRYDPELDDRAAVPIGRPAANVEIYVLDKGLNPAPENVAGGLFISGDGLAAGYLNRPELSEESFIDNPFIPGKKMYRTGDLARHLPEGIIEFIGRDDDQVKYHGHRIELNEIRAALNQHPQIRDSVITLTKDRNGNDLLIAYYVSRQELEVAPLRVFLSERVIQETIPNVLIHIEKIPLTLNGKISYQALPTLEEALRLKHTYVAPRTDDESLLANIWAQVLGIEQVGIHDDFFELGGHSLLATQVTARVREAFQVELPMTWLFEAPTVADLASVIEHLRQVQKDGVSDRIEKVDRGASEDILAKLDQLPDEKVDSLLNSLTAGKGEAGGGFGLSDQELDLLYKEILSEEEEVRE